MTRALSARTAELAGKRTLRAVPLVTLTTYSDRDAGTVDTVRRFSTAGIAFDSGDWLPYLQRIDPQTMTMAHIPDSQGLDGAFDREMRLVLRKLLGSGKVRQFAALWSCLFAAKHAVSCCLCFLIRLTAAFARHSAPLPRTPAPRFLIA